jgi:hypothetical protein
MEQENMAISLLEGSPDAELMSGNDPLVPQMFW